MRIAPRPVVVPVGAFRFCRIAVSALLWGAVALRSVPLAAATGLLLLLSAAAGVERAPLVALWAATVERLRPTPPVVLDRKAIRFAHVLGAALTLAAAAWMARSPVAGGWALVVVAILKTAAAAGGCSAARLYGCLSEGGCCAFVERRDG